MKTAIAEQPRRRTTGTAFIEKSLEAGTVELHPSGYAFLRKAENSYLPSAGDIYVSPAQVRRFSLTTGMTVEGVVRPTSSSKNPALVRVTAVNGRDVERSLRPERRRFEDLTSLHPAERFVLESDAEEISARALDLIAPVGKGQRGLIVSPPRAGKTLLLQAIARALLRNHPECFLFILLIDERPEEVTEIRTSVRGPTVEIANSTFDRPAREHIRVAEMILDKAKRMVEEGRHVVILLDSVTRLARAYNTEAGCGGRLLSGGITVGALDAPKRFFGAARRVEEGGSLTILATALIDTGSRMDQVIFEEFKGTGNMEVYLDRRLADRRIWPAININASGTRREELLLDPQELRLVSALRRALSALNPVEAMELLTSRLKKTQSNGEFLVTMQLA